MWKRPDEVLRNPTTRELYARFGDLWFAVPELDGAGRVAVLERDELPNWAPLASQYVQKRIQPLRGVRA